MSPGASWQDSAGGGPPPPPPSPAPHPTPPHPQPPYMAPERLRAGRLLAAVDVYSFAFVMWKKVWGGERACGGARAARGGPAAATAMALHDRWPELSRGCPAWYGSLMQLGAGAQHAAFLSGSAGGVVLSLRGAELTALSWHSCCTGTNPPLR